MKNNMLPIKYVSALNEFLI